MLKTLKESPENIHQTSTPGFCTYYPQGKNSKTKKSCALCSTPICLTHTVFYCIECELKIDNDED